MVPSRLVLDPGCQQPPSSEELTFTRATTVSGPGPQELFRSPQNAQNPPYTQFNLVKPRRFMALEGLDGGQGVRWSARRLARASPVSTGLAEPTVGKIDWSHA